MSARDWLKNTRNIPNSILNRFEKGELEALSKKHAYKEDVEIIIINFWKHDNKRTCKNCTVCTANIGNVDTFTSIWINEVLEGVVPKKKVFTTKTENGNILVVKKEK